MKHLTVEEMIDFVSFHKIDQDTLAFASRIQAHLLTCEACRKKVNAFQKIYDAMLDEGKKPGRQAFAMEAKEFLSNGTQDGSAEKEDGYR